jgi:hypothetical protein
MWLVRFIKNLTNSFNPHKQFPIKISNLVSSKRGYFFYASKANHTKLRAYR